MTHRWRVEATIPCLPSKDAEQGATVEAVRIDRALRLAAKEILARPGVKGRRVRTAVFRIARVEGGAA